MASPQKKNSYMNHNYNNTDQKAYTNEKVERINVTIPNPLLMPSANVQIQYLQEIVRNVIQRVDDIFHLKQIVDIKNNKLKDKALANSDQDSTNVFDEVKSLSLRTDINQRPGTELGRTRIRTTVRTLA